MMTGRTTTLTTVAAVLVGGPLAAQATTGDDPGGSTPVPARPLAEHVFEGAATLVMSFQGDSMGTAVYETRRTPGGEWEMTETTVLGDFDVAAVNRTVVDSEFSPVEFRASGSMFGNEVDISVDFEGAHASGNSVFPRQSGPASLPIELPMPDGTLERTAVFFLAHALPYEEGAQLELSWLDTYSGQIQPITAVVTGTETLTVPAGEFTTWRIDLQGGTPSQVLWVSQDTPRRIVRMEVVGQPWTYELVHVSN